MVSLCSKSTQGANQIEILARERIGNARSGNELTCDATSVGTKLTKANIGFVSYLSPTE